MSARETPRITITRTFPGAHIDDVWDLWTTREGIEAWWGPDGFCVKVDALDLRPGGQLRYRMCAVAPEMVAFMKQAGMQVEQPTSLTYDEVVPGKRLAYTNLADFIPGVKPYDVATVVELFVETAGVRMELSFDPMHDPIWTDRQRMGWESEVEKLARVLAQRAKGGA